MKKIITLLASTLIALDASALELPELIGPDMMLQQQTDAKLWGWAKGGSTVEVTTSWDGMSYKAKADKSTGRWSLKVATPAASFTPQTITIKGDGETRRLDNVLIGEVWFCSGQSNMEMPLNGYWNCPVEGSNEAIAMSGRYRRSLRLATIQKVGKDTPQDRVPGQWKVCEPQSAAWFSALGYYFARTLTDLLDVPVGVINCSWGGSCVEGWLPKEILLGYPDGLTPIDDTDYHAKMIMYNGMLHPLMGYTIRGFLWNQGESNVGREKEYIDRFQTMIKLWRDNWDQPGAKLPVYTVELPPYWYDQPDGEAGALFREAQHIIASQQANSGCVCTNDLVYDHELKQIHATQKLAIGQRMAYMAAVRDYGMTGLWGEMPQFEAMKVVEANGEDQVVIAGTAVSENPAAKGKVAVLTFTNCQDGFDRMTDIEGFEVAGSDGVYHKAIAWSAVDWSAQPSRCCIKLACPEVNDIAHVRYNFKNWAPGKLHNTRGLPIVPFRTDK